MATVMSLPTKPRAVEQRAAQTLANIERFYRCTVHDLPTPMMSESEIDYWAQRYDFHDLAKRGLPFILFLQCPRQFLLRMA